MSSTPVIVIELFLIGGVAIGFALWDLRSLERERRKRLRQREAQAAPPERIVPEDRDASTRSHARDE
jgi:hypothetical protein